MESVVKITENRVFCTTQNTTLLPRLELLMVDLETLVQNTRLPHTKLELLIGDFVFETLVQITPLRKLELLMEDFPS